MRISDGDIVPRSAGDRGLRGRSGAADHGLGRRVTGCGFHTNRHAAPYAARNGSAVPARPRRRPRRRTTHDASSAALISTRQFPLRSFLTSSSEGNTRSPGTYSQLVMIPTPRLASSFVVPTQAPIVDWPSEARKVIGPTGVSTLRPRNAATSLSVSVEPALRIASAIET